MLFLLEIAVTPLLVAGVALAARWWGPTVGGILIGLPWFTGPVVFIRSWIGASSSGWPPASVS
jgi:hypothetical protein